MMMIHPVPERNSQSSAPQEVLPSEHSPFPLASSVGIMAGSGCLNGSLQRPGGPTYREQHKCSADWRGCYLRVGHGGWLSEQRFARGAGVLLDIQAASQVRVTYQPSVNLKWWFRVPQGGAVQSC